MVFTQRLPTDLNPKIPAGILLLVCLASVGEILHFDWPFAYVIGPGLLAFFALEWPRLAKIAKVLVVVAVLLGTALITLDKIAFDMLAKAISRAGFLTFFLVSLGFLQSAADSSLMVRRCGEAIVHQPPGRRYVMLTVGASLFSVFLSLGTISLLGTMVKNGIDAGRTTTEARISEIRLQRMMLAILRGFCTMVLWSPITITLVVVLTAIPELTWLEILPYGLCVTASYVFVGWLIDRWTFPRSRQIPTDPKGLPLTVFLPLLGLVFLILALALILSFILSINQISALLIVIPFVALGWMLFQYQSLGESLALAKTFLRVRDEVLPALPLMRSEICIFASSAFIGLLIPRLIDVDAVGGGIALLNLAEGWVLVLSFWAIALLAMIGVNPIISVTIAVDLLPRLPGLDISPLSVALMAITAWSIIVGFSPFSAAVRIAGRVIDRDITDVGIRWNGPFSLIIGLLFSGALLLLG